MKKPEIYSDNPMDYVRVALAIETLAYHNKNYLDRSINDNYKISEEVQSLLIAALEHDDNDDKKCDTYKECEHSWIYIGNCTGGDYFTCVKCGANKTIPRYL